MAILRARGDPETVRLLQQVPIFSALTERQLGSLARDGKERTYAEGAVVVKEGEEGLGFYLVLDGKVEVRRKNRRLAALGPGQFFGEMALFGDQPRSADVLATAPTKCLVLSRWEFRGFATAQPKVLFTIIEEIARRLSETNKALSE
jgi:CRP/FNR family transcriptional regulator, cyclic AMP receptor protein